MDKNILVSHQFLIGNRLYVGGVSDYVISVAFIQVSQANILDRTS